MTTKRKILFVFATAAITMLHAGAVLAQSHVSIHGNANMVSNDNKSWALKVGDKVVTGYDYLQFKSTDGVYFAVEDKNGKWGVCDDTGAFLFPCRFAKTSVSGSLAMLYEDANGEPEIYDCKTKTYVQARQVGADFFENEAKFKERKSHCDFITRQAKEMSASLSPEFRFEVVNNEDYTRQDIVVDGKVRSSWDEIAAIRSSAAQDGKTGWWLFTVRNSERKVGAYLIQVYERDGKLVTFRGLTIPCKFAMITNVQGRDDLLVCREEISLLSSSNAEFCFDWIGFERENNTFENFPKTGREWVCVDRETDQWELRTTQK